VAAPVVAPAPAPAEAPAAATAPVSDDNTVVMTLESVAAAWPDAVLQEIQQFNLVSESVSIPVSRIEPGMKAGRIAFTWGELCGWLSDPLPPSANGHHELELPLAVIAPQFLTKRRAPTPRKVVTVGADVPDLFAGLAKPPAPEPEPQPEPVVAEAPPAAAEVPAETAEEAPQPELAPQEVVEWIMTLPGVAGALLASNDGLLVAGQLPAPLEAETMAAFLPQILMRIGICTEEIRLGPLRSVMLFVGKTPCAMFKAGSLCLAVLGHPGKTLPEAALERMAGELAQLNQ
jgi:predicted regulator of Ras-like GTPase activity (Roadblock/LC7/MglB family)